MEDIWEEISIGGDNGNDMDISLVSKCTRCLVSTNFDENVLSMTLIVLISPVTERSSRDGNKRQGGSF